MKCVYKNILKLLTSAFFWKMLKLSRYFYQTNLKAHKIKTADQSSEKLVQISDKTEKLNLSLHLASVDFN